MADRHTSEVLSQRDFNLIADLAFETAGIDLKEGKRELVQARLAKKMREGRFASFDQYYHHVLDDRTGEELTSLLDALTTNFTSFLREIAHFDFLRKTILPEIKGPIRVWSAACSTGEEPFTIAFCLLEELGMNALGRISILATDISTKVLATAQRAAYQAERFRECPSDWPRKYLLRGSGRSEGWCLVKPEIRRRIEFRRLNLMESVRLPQPVHVIFIRNVMIYFNKDTQEQLVNRLAACLETGGYLLIGHSESLTGLQHPYQYIQPAIYRKPL